MPHTPFVLPVIELMLFGDEYAFTERQKVPVIPHEFTAFTHMLPLTLLFPPVTVIDVVPCPLKITRPDGTVQVYEVAPKIELVEKVTVSSKQNNTGPLIAVGFAGFP